jgi:serine/threonine protein kinase
MQPSSDPLIGTQVSEYVIQEQIGTGGMGVVYRAVQPLIGKQVAIKVLRAESAGTAELVQRLLIEARAVNAIQHRGIIDIFGFGALPDGRPYVVMELLQGVSLDAFIRKHKPVSATETAAILDEMLAALGAAHRAGVIHRDLKPGNVFLCERSDGSRAVKLLDFGIAKVAEIRLPRPLTAEGTVLGTPAYMAPEQVRGEKLTAAADLYSVGVIAFQMLTGRLPFRGDPGRVLLSHVEVPPPAPSSLVAEVPAQLESIVLRLLSKLPSERFPSADAIRQELKDFHPDHEPASPRRASGKTGRRPTVSLAPRTIEVPMLAAAASQEPVSRPAPRIRASLSRSALPLLLLCVGTLVLAASAGAVDLPVSLPAPIAQGLGAAPQQPPADIAARVEPPRSRRAESPARKDKLSRPAPESSAPALSSEAPEPSSNPRGQIDQKTLKARVMQIDTHLNKLDPQVCSVTAMAQLKDIQRQADLAATDEQRTTVAQLLTEWEQKFLAKR